jgi:hypothetical protein
MLGAILRIYSYIYHLLISIALIGLALVAWLSENPNLKQDLLPWEGKSLVLYMFVLGFIGVVSVILSFLGKLRILFLVWALAVVVMLVRGIMLGGMRFENADAFRSAIYFIAAGLLALIGAWSAFRHRA